MIIVNIECSGRTKLTKSVWLRGHQFDFSDYVVFGKLKIKLQFKTFISTLLVQVFKDLG